MRDETVKELMTKDPREEKLLHWIQDKINGLRTAVQDAQRELHALKEGTETNSFYLEGMDNQRRFYLPRFQTLRFGGDTWRAINIYEDRCSPGELCINGSDPIQIDPVASNFVRIKLKG